MHHNIQSSNKSPSPRQATGKFHKRVTNAKRVSTFKLRGGLATALSLEERQAVAAGLALNSDQRATRQAVQTYARGIGNNTAWAAGATIAHQLSVRNSWHKAGTEWRAAAHRADKWRKDRQRRQGHSHRREAVRASWATVCHCVCPLIGWGYAREESRASSRRAHKSWRIEGN